MFIDIQARIKELDECINFLTIRLKDLEKELPNVSCVSRKISMQQSRRANKELIKKYQNDKKELERFL